MESNSGVNFCVPTIGVIYRNHFTKQKTQELGCLRPWLTDDEAVLHI